MSLLSTTYGGYRGRRRHKRGSVSPGINVSAFEDYIDALHTAGVWTRCHRFKFNDNTGVGTTANDGVNVVNAGILQSSSMANQTVTSKADATQKGVSFNGTNQYVAWNQPHFGYQVKVMTDIGAAFFVLNTSASPTTTATIMDFVNNSGATPRMSLAITATSGKLDFTHFKVASSDYRKRIWDNASLFDGANHFVALVQRGDGTGVQLYIDGVQITSYTDSTAGTPDSTNAWIYTFVNNTFYNDTTNTKYIGALARPVQDYFKGTVDHASWIDGLVTDEHLADLQFLRT